MWFEGCGSLGGLLKGLHKGKGMAGSHASMVRTALREIHETFWRSKGQDPRGRKQNGEMEVQTVLCGGERQFHILKGHTEGEGLGKEFQLGMCCV